MKIRWKFLGWMAMGVGLVIIAQHLLIPLLILCLLPKQRGGWL